MGNATSDQTQTSSPTHTLYEHELEKALVLFLRFDSLEAVGFVFFLFSDHRRLARAEMILADIHRVREAVKEEFAAERILLKDERCEATTKEAARCTAKIRRLETNVKKSWVGLSGKVDTTKKDVADFKAQLREKDETIKNLQEELRAHHHDGGGRRRLDHHHAGPDQLRWRFY